MKKKNIVLIGDSITAGFDTKRYFPDDIFINKGVSGDSTVECLERITIDWFLEKPSTVFLCIGTNDFARERTDQFVLKNIMNIVEKINRFTLQSTIYLTSIFPTRENKPRPNERIHEFNTQLKQLSINVGCRYYDLHQHFIDEQGNLKKEFTDDGLHLTENGYKAWSEELNAFLQDEGKK